jgi:hypothetical protein
MRLNLRNTGQRRPRNTATAPPAPASQGAATGWPPATEHRPGMTTNRPYPADSADEAFQAQHPLPDLGVTGAGPGQHLGGDTLAVAEHGQQDVLGADVVVPRASASSTVSSSTFFARG